MITAVVIGAIIFIVVLTLVSTKWTLSKSKTILHRWAEAEGYTIISSEYRWFGRGPFAWRTADGQVVFYVSVKTAEGQTKQGWVCCGSRWKGLVDDKVEVRWDTKNGGNDTGVLSP